MSNETVHLARLASQARPTGSAALDDARRYCTAVLSDLGFDVAPRAFEFSAFPGHLGTPLVGTWVAAAISVTAGLAARAVGSVVPLLVLAAGLTVAVGCGRYLGRSGVLSFPAMRRQGVNLEAVRGSVAPRVWLVAHADSKGQPIPSAVRAGGIVVLGLAALAAVVVSLTEWRTGRSTGAWPIVVLVTWTGAIPVMLSLVVNRGTGALDNASGVAAVLAAAELLPRTAPVGVLITDAEEFGLAGARAWSRDRSPAVALNCDGVDDEGALTMMYSGRAPHRVTGALRAAAGASGQALRVMRVVPGVLTDSVAFAAAGWETATLSHGSLRTLGRVHTSSDTLAELRGTSIATAATVLSRTATELC